MAPLSNFESDRRVVEILEAIRRKILNVIRDRVRHHRPDRRIWLMDRYARIRKCSQAELLRLFGLAIAIFLDDWHSYDERFLDALAVNYLEEEMTWSD